MCVSSADHNWLSCLDKTLKACLCRKESDMNEALFIFLPLVSPGSACMWTRWWLTPATISSTHYSSLEEVDEEGSKQMVVLRHPHGFSTSLFLFPLCPLAIKWDPMYQRRKSWNLKVLLPNTLLFSCSFLHFVFSVIMLHWVYSQCMYTHINPSWPRIPL